MKILLFKKTTDSDLTKDLQVCYKDINGQHTQIGTIEAVNEDCGIKLYQVNGASYMADELKLIAPTGSPINDFDTLKAEVSKTGQFVEVSEELFYYALGVLPPIYLKNGTFQMGECYSRDFYYTFGEKGGKYYGCLCNKNFALNNF